jgi:hypothetical protein
MIPYVFLASQEAEQNVLNAEVKGISKGSISRPKVSKKKLNL